MVLTALGLVLVLVAASYGFVTFQTVAARNDLTSAQNRVEELNRQEREFDALVSTQQQSQTIKAQLTTLLATDVQWRELVGSIRGAAPGTVRLTSVTGTVASGAEAGVKSDADRLPNLSGERLIGAVTVIGSGTTKAAVADYVDALAKIPGLANPALGNATTQNGRVSFTVQLDITRLALGGRYTPEGGNQAGGK
jgi:hypothetical protein